MARDFIEVEFREHTGRYANGLIGAVWLRSTLGSILWWLDRETDELQELRPYRYGTYRGRRQ